VQTPRRRKLGRELFETRSHAWESLGLGDELLPRSSKRGFSGLLVALLVLSATLFVYYNRRELLPGYGSWVRIATVAVLIVVGSAATHWLVQALSRGSTGASTRRRRERWASWCA
jgi:hypothetical protein